MVSEDPTDSCKRHGIRDTPYWWPLRDTVDWRCREQTP